MYRAYPISGIVNDLKVLAPQQGFFKHEPQSPPPLPPPLASATPPITPLPIPSYRTLPVCCQCPPPRSVSSPTATQRGTVWVGWAPTLSLICSPRLCSPQHPPKISPSLPVETQNENHSGIPPAAPSPLPFSSQPGAHFPVTEETLPSTGHHQTPSTSRRTPCTCSHQPLSAALTSCSTWPRRHPQLFEILLS